MNLKKSAFNKNIIVALILSTCIYSNNALSATRGDTDALIIIGSSYANGTTRIDDNQLASLGGLAVGSGAYLSLGDALVRERNLNGLVINEGNVGNTTFDRFSCFASQCLPFGKLLGYQKQFENALKRTAIYNPSSPGVITGYNAKYMIIGIPNDCVHSDAFGVPQSDTQPCTIAEINEIANNIIAIANQAESLGITVIIPIMPKYKSLDLGLVQLGLGLQWVADEYEYNDIRDTLKYRFRHELPDALVVNIWKKFVHRGDGIHPSKKNVKRAARKISLIIKEHKDIK